MRLPALFICLLLIFSLLRGQDWQQPATQSFHDQEAALKNKIAKAIVQGRVGQTEGQADFDVKYYRLDLRIDPQKRTVSGSVTVSGIALSDGLQQIELDLHHRMVVDSVTTDSAKLSFNHQADLLSVQWPVALEATQSFSFKVFYSGTPEQSYFGAFVFDSNGGQPMIWSLSEPFGARNWWPCKDAPADKADSADVVVTVPSDLTVASNGLLRSVTEQNGWKTFWWHESYPITTYLVSVAIHPYYQFTNYYVNPEGDSMPVVNYVFPSQKKYAESELPRTIRMLEIFSGFFGPYPFFREKYGHAQFTWGGGMEHQTITSLVSFGEELVVHELAHQWWGDMVTCETYHHIWLNEGFATYCEALYYEKLLGKDRYHQHMNGMQYFGGGTIYVYDPVNDQIFHGGLSYNKGAWVLHMLRHVVGDEAFFTILQSYYKDERFQYKTATTEGFRDLCEEITGMDLHRFFQQWIYEPGYPTYLLNWQAKQQDDGSYKVDGMLDQSRDSRIFWMPVDVTIKTATAETTFVVWADDEANSFSCTLKQQPTEVVLDKDNWILNQQQTISIPQIRFDGPIVADFNGNGNARLDAGEQIELYLKFSNPGARANNVIIAVSSQDADVSFLKNSSALVNIPTGNEPIQTIEPLLLNVEPTAISHRATFTLTLEYGNTEKRSYVFTLPIGEPNVLFVSDAADLQESAFAKSALDSGGVHAKLWEASVNGAPNADTLSRYQALVWNTGSKREQVLASAEIELLKTFVDQGGKLLIAGQNIAAFLNGTEAGQAFLADYLGSSFYQDTFTGSIIKGLTSVPMTDGVFIRFLDDQNKRTQESPDMLTTTGSGETVLQFMPTNYTAGVRLQRGSARIVYFAFGLEALSRRAKDSSKDLLHRTMLWLQGIDTKVAQTNNGDKGPDLLRLFPNYPNPFNPSTEITFTLPTPAKVELAVYNSNGQKVKSLLATDYAAGTHSVTWDGRNQSGEDSGSGVYFIRVEAGRQYAMQKVLKLK